MPLFSQSHANSRVFASFVARQKKNPSVKDTPKNAFEDISGLPKTSVKDTPKWLFGAISGAAQQAQNQINTSTYSRRHEVGVKKAGSELRWGEKLSEPQASSFLPRKSCRFLANLMRAPAFLLLLSRNKRRIQPSKTTKKSVPRHFGPTQNFRQRHTKLVVRRHFGRRAASQPEAKPN